jgi:hypothetical protein
LTFLKYFGNIARAALADNTHLWIAYLVHIVFKQEEADGGKTIRSTKNVNYFNETPS